MLSFEGNLKTLDFKWSEYNRLSISQIIILGVYSFVTCELCLKPIELSVLVDLILPIHRFVKVLILLLFKAVDG